MATFTGTAAADTIDATTGSTGSFTGGTSAELVDAIGDFFLGLGGDDSITAGSGDDILRGGLGADILRGGAGSDTADYLDNFGAVFINLYIGRGFGNAAEGDTYDSIENATGSIFNDTLLGSAGVNVLNGSQGNDFLIGYLGADTLIGGTGFDIASYEDNAGSIFINMITGRGFNNAAEGDILTGIEAIIGTSYADYIISGSSTGSEAQPGSDAYIDVGAGNDFVISGTGRDTLIGGAGEDTVSFQNEQTGVGVNLRSGTASAFRVDSLSGFENVMGSRFGDTIVGDDNNNVLYGRDGADTLTGGEGIDTFVFDTALRSGNVDTITDFTEYDHIYLDRNVFTALPYGELSPNAFLIGTQATTAEQRVIYNPATGALLYDSDGSGSGAAIQFATLQGAPSITSSEFFVIG